MSGKRLFLGCDDEKDVNTRKGGGNTGGKECRAAESLKVLESEIQEKGLWEAGRRPFFLTLIAYRTKSHLVVGRKVILL